MRTFLFNVNTLRGATTTLGALLVIGALVVPEDALAVAGFARQTGMNCNSCHTLHGAPTPNFTFTGKKFNALGYRLPSGLHHITDRSQEQGESEDENHGEHLKLLPTTFSGRFQYQLANTSKGPGADAYGPTVTNPTSRLAFFPFTGPVGDHWGIWTEYYIVPFTSDDNEWGIADASYEEFDFRYIIDPENDDTITGFALTNQGAYQLFGFGPFPGLPSEIDGRGGIGGYTHPNRGQLYHYGWVDNRWVYAIGADTGDTNYNWDDWNVVGFLGYALGNRNDDELWLNFVFRTGNDALPLVTASGARDSSRTWQYRDAVGGISATRGDPCPGVAGARNTGSCAYLSEELDDHFAADFEVRWGGQNVANFFGQSAAGPWSFEMVGRIAYATEEYFDGAETTRTSWGFQPMIGYKHTYYLKPLLSGDIDYTFTDSSGVEHDIDTLTRWTLALAYKPTENYLIYLQYGNNQRLALGEDAEEGEAFAITADISF